jgi:hypothetical protein
LLHVDMLAHNKRDIAYQENDWQPENVVIYKREPHLLGGSSFLA